MTEMSAKIQRRTALAVDIAAFTISFYIALILRYNGIPKLKILVFSYDGIYVLCFVICIIFYCLIYLFRDSRRHQSGQQRLVDQDIIEIFAGVFRTQVFVFVTLLAFLFVVHKGNLVSRKMLAYTFLICLPLDFLLKLLLTKYIKRINEKYNIREKILLLVSRSNALTVIRKLQQTAGREISIGGVYIIDGVPDSIVPESIPAVYVKKDLYSLIKSENFQKAFLYLQGDEKEYPVEIIENLEKLGIQVMQNIVMNGCNVGGKMLGCIGCYQISMTPDFRQKCNVLGVHFTPANMDGMVFHILKHARELSGKYICFCNVHTTVESRENSDYCEVQNGAAFVMADGMPIMRQERRKGFSDAERVAGPDFMAAMFAATMDGKLSHYFYGSKKETLRKLKKSLLEKYPGIDIRGLYSPPFRELTEKEDEEDIQKINASKADIIWIGLGAPKQEKWMAVHQGKIHGVMMGVGAGFDFHAGTIKRAPVWMQKISMEWLYRLFQDPKRLIRRYFISNIKFLWYSVKDSFAHPDNGNG
jgi:exopolysaccharide biosynthesis WecB/TagA/CpsF family protein